MRCAGSVWSSGGSSPVRRVWSIGKCLLEKFEGRARGSAKTVDSLVGIADRKDIPIGACEAGKNSDLGEVGVLKFVGQDEAGAGAGSA